MDKEKKKELASATIRVINAFHVMDDGEPLVDDKNMLLWMDILTKAPEHIFIHPERHWEIEKYVKEEIKNRSK